MEQNLQNKLYKHAKTFSKNLKFERESRKLTQKVMADKIGIKTQSYQAYESGISLPSSENLLKIAIIFELSIDELFDIK